MGIEFLEILPRTGVNTTALFRVDDKKVKISITDTLGTIWKINSDKEMELAIKQIGELEIRLMLAKSGELKNHMFKTYDVQRDDGSTLNFGETIEKIKDEILEADKERN